MSEATLPDHVESEGVAPTLVADMKDRVQLVTWLAERILEIEVALRPAPLPTVAVLVNDESEVQSVADDLNAALEPHNLKAVACLSGQMIGQENDIRVFNVEHIKGLEFEAVFFLDVDRLAARLPDLFDKYLYVGATRAATYLGITCEGKLPTQIAPLEHQFAANWP
jgi:DNA helicase IV